MSGRCEIYYRSIYFDPKDPEKPSTGAKSENGTEWWLIPQIKRGIVF